MGDNGGVAVALSEFDGAEGFGEGADLVHLNENRVGAAEFDALFEVLDVGNEEVVADELAVFADEVGENLPAFPVAFGHAVFDGVDGIFFNEFLEEFGLLCAGELGSVCALLPRVVVNAVVEEFGGSAVETDGHVAAGHVACLFDSLDDNVEGVFSAVEGGSEAAFVANGGAEAAGLEDALEVVEYFGAHADAFAEGACADGANHEFLEADGGVGVSAAVDDVHHRHGEHVGVASADVLVEGKVEVVGGSLCNGEGNAEDCVCAEVALGVGAVEGEHGLVDSNLVEGAHAYEGLSDGAVDVGYGFEDAFAHVAGFVAVAELKGFVNARGSARGNGSAAFGAGFEDYVYFNSGVAARVEHLTTNDFFNFHSCNNFLCRMLVFRICFPARAGFYRRKFTNFPAIKQKNPQPEAGPRIFYDLFIGISGCKPSKRSFRLRGCRGRFRGL